MCCLTFENDTYRHLKQEYPKIGATVETPEGRGKVVRHNVMNHRLSVKLEKGGIIETELKNVAAGKS
jgi:cell fate regulator YaaT (PSP1 superfamily)